MATAFKVKSAADSERDWLARKNELGRWPKLARARSDLAAQRPGWDSNWTRNRLAAAAGEDPRQRETALQRGSRQHAGRGVHGDTVITDPRRLRAFIAERAAASRARRSGEPEGRR